MVDILTTLLSLIGVLLTTYDKHFLYETDEIWATEGESFKCIDVEGIGKVCDVRETGPRNAYELLTAISTQVGVGICMDLNPYRFQNPFDAYEFARFQLANDASLILTSMAWLSEAGGDVDGGTDDNDQNGEPKSDDDEAVWEVLQYWAQRMNPILRESRKEGRSGKRVLLVVCNRFGKERGMRLTLHSVHFDAFFLTCFTRLYILWK